MVQKGQNQDPIWVDTKGNTKIFDNGDMVIKKNIKVSTDSILFEDTSIMSTNTENPEWFNCITGEHKELIVSPYNDAGSTPPYYSKKEALRTLDAQLLDDAQSSSFQVTFPTFEQVHFQQVIVIPRASGLAKFVIKDTDENGCILNTLTEYDFQPGEVDTEVTISLENRIKLRLGQFTWVDYNGPNVAGHNFVSDPTWGTQFVPFIKTNSQPFVDVRILTDDRDRVSVYKSLAQTIIKETWTDLTFDNERYDVGDMHDNVTNNERVTIITTGLHQINYLINIESKKDTDYQGRIYKNGIALLPDSQLCVFSPKDDTDVCIQHSFDAELTADDYITLQVYQGSSVNRDVHAEKTFFQVRQI
jgi:hypothetical protein